jgi:putative endonuclease
VHLDRLQTSTSSRRSRRNSAIGRTGEDHAAAHLRRRGYRVLARNLRAREGEIDIVACDATAIVFVEVKTSRARRTPTSTAAAGPQTPLERLLPRQRARLRRLAAAWLSDQSNARPYRSTIRFDAIGVLLDSRDRLLRLDHIEDAW